MTRIVSDTVRGLFHGVVFALAAATAGVIFMEASNATGWVAVAFALLLGLVLALGLLDAYLVGAACRHLYDDERRSEYRQAHEVADRRAA